MSGDDASSSTTDRESTATDRDLIREWVVYGAGLFALVGIGFGLLDILANAVDEDLLDVPDDAGFEAIDTAIQGATSFSLMSTPYVAVVLSVGLGAFFGWFLTRDDELAFKIAAATAAAGTAACWLLAGIFASAALDNVSLDFAGLLINIIVASAVAALVAVGGVWLTRNHAPGELTARAPR